MGNAIFNLRKTKKKEMNKGLIKLKDIFKKMGWASEEEAFRKEVACLDVKRSLGIDFPSTSRELKLSLQLEDCWINLYEGSAIASENPFFENKESLQIGYLKYDKEFKPQIEQITCYRVSVTGKIFFTMEEALRDYMLEKKKRS